MSRDYKQFAEQVLLDATKYSGNQDSKKKIFSASMLGNDPLQNYLKYMHGGKDGTKFEANSFGSVFHLGAEVAFKDIESADVEKSMSVELSNGWIISGSVDLILNEHKTIIDWKTTTATAIAKSRTEGKHGGYGLQLGVYRYLLWKTENKLYNTALGMIDKGYSYFKANKNEQLEFVDIETHEPEEIEQLLLDATNELQQYIDLEQPPSQCKELWFFGRKGQTKVPMRCVHYCDQKNNCPYYSDKHELNRILDL